MEPLNAATVVADCGGAASGALTASFPEICTDTRSLRPGSLFVALRGENFDGHAFLAAAAAAGAGAALVDAAPAEAPPTLPLIRVKDTGRALLDLAAAHRRRLKAKVIAITGSNGKTTTKELTAAVLAARFKTVKSPLSFNNAVGVPMTLFLADRTTEAVVLEVGTNHPGEIAMLAAVARPDVAVVTNVGAAHLEGLGSVEGVLQEKGALIEHVREGGFAVLNGDDDRSIAALRARATCRVVTTGVRRRADYVATMPHCDLERVAFHLNGKTKVRCPLLGCHNLYNALTALAIAVELGVPEDAAATALRSAEGPPMRLKKHRAGRMLVIDDSYNANPGSMVAAIKTFASLQVPGRRIVVLGDMAELGPKSPELHREVGTQLSCGRFDLVIGVGQDAAAHLGGARERGIPDATLVHCKDADAAIRELAERLRSDDAVLVKGSRRMALERVVQSILGAGAAFDREGREAPS